MKQALYRSNSLCSRLRWLAAGLALCLAAACGGGGGASESAPAAANAPADAPINDPVNTGNPVDTPAVAPPANQAAEASAPATPQQQTAIPVGISLTQRNLGVVLDLATDAQGNTIAVLLAGRPVARKFAPDGSPVAYGPDGQGLTLPGQGPTANLSPATLYTGAAFAGSGEAYVSNITTKGVGINAIGATGGSISRISTGGEVTVLANWPAESAGAVAPASVTLGPDGALYFVDYLSGHLMKWTAQAGASSVADVQAFPNGLVYEPRAFWIAVESANRIHVLGRSALSAGGSLLKRIDGRTVSVLAGNTDGGPNVDGTGAAAAFSPPVGFTLSPSGLALGSGGNVYVADGLVVRKVSPDGVVTTVAGQRGINVLATGPLPGSLGTLGAMTIGADGVIHVMTDAQGSSPLLLEKSQVKSLAKIRLE